MIHQNKPESAPIAADVLWGKGRCVLDVRWPKPNCTTERRKFAARGELSFGVGDF